MQGKRQSKPQHSETSQLQLSTVLEVMNALLAKQRKIQQTLEFQTNKIDELLDRQFTSDKVMHRIEGKVDKILMGKAANVEGRISSINYQPGIGGRVDRPDSSVNIQGGSVHGGSVHGERRVDYDESEYSQLGGMHVPLSRVQSERSNLIQSERSNMMQEPIPEKTTPKFHNQYAPVQQQNSQKQKIGIISSRLSSPSNRNIVNPLRTSTSPHNNSNNNHPQQEAYYPPQSNANNTFLDSSNLDGDVSSRRKSRSIPKHLFDTKVMVKPHPHNATLSQFQISGSEKITSKFTGWYQILLDKPVNMSNNDQCYFEIKVHNSNKFNIMVGICDINRIKCISSYSSGKALALNLWNFHIYSKAGAEKMKAVNLYNGCRVKVQIGYEVVSWFLNGQFITRAIIPPQLRLCTLVGYMEIYDKGDCIRLN